MDAATAVPASETTRVPPARITGLVYLLYLAALDLAWIFVGRRPDVCRAALLMANVFYLALGLLFYAMFRPVSRRVALEALLFSIVGNAIGILHVFGIATEVRAIPFLACFALLVGWLIVRSAFLPHILGWLMVLCGAGWLAYLVPAVAALSHGRMSDVSFLMEGLLALQLAVKGMNRERWLAQARGTPPPVAES